MMARLKLSAEPQQRSVSATSAASADSFATAEGDEGWASAEEEVHEAETNVKKCRSSFPAYQKSKISSHKRDYQMAARQDSFGIFEDGNDQGEQQILTSEPELLPVLKNISGNPTKNFSPGRPRALTAKSQPGAEDVISPHLSEDEDGEEKEHIVSQLLNSSFNDEEENELSSLLCRESSPAPSGRSLSKTKAQSEQSNQTSSPMPSMLKNSIDIQDTICSQPSTPFSVSPSAPSRPPSSLSESHPDGEIWLSGSDSSLADFIVSDSASETELKRGYSGTRKKQDVSPARLSPRKIVIDSSDEESTDSNSGTSECQQIYSLTSSKTHKTHSKNPKTSPTDIATQLSTMSLSPLFDSIKYTLAESFLAELDERITRGFVADSAGYIPIDWSNGLKTAAGKAIFKPVRVILANADPMAPVIAQAKPTRKVQTTIRLASSIIKSESQLLNTLAHEFCHIAVWHVDNDHKHKHGKLFKKWARRVEKEFRHKKVKITTRHRYEIELKFAWRCKGCGREYRRATRSIDISKRVCAGCHGKLEAVEEIGPCGDTEEGRNWSS